MKLTGKGNIGMKHELLFGAFMYLLALMLGASAALAHNGVEHLMGTVNAVTETSISVDTVKHTTVTVALNPSAQFSHNGAGASWKDLKVGERVAVDAKENAEKKLVAVSVKWGANGFEIPRGSRSA